MMSAANQSYPETTIQRIGGKDFEIKLSHTGASLARQIVNVNKRIIYTPINLIGMPGFGKTTGTHQLVSEIKKIDDSYIVKWYKKDDLLNIDKILAGLPKYQNYILVFDDVSYLLDPGSISPERKSEILHQLTIVREILDPERKRARAILMLDFHYSYAVPKSFRQANFSIQFSITDEERENYLKKIGYDKYKRRKIARFIDIFERAYKSDTFTMKLRSGKEITYETDNPYRPALVFNFSRIHFWLFYKVNDAATGPVRKIDEPDSQFWSEVVRKYGFSRVLKVLRLYTFVQTGAPVIPALDKKIWNHIRDQNAKNSLPLKELVAVLRDAKKQPKSQQEPKMMESLQKLQELVVAKNNDTEGKIEMTQEAFLASIVANDEQDNEEEGGDDDQELDLDDSVMQNFGAEDSEE